MTNTFKNTIESRLVSAIINQTVKDYVLYGRKIKSLQKKGNKIPDLLKRDFAQATNFFNSEWFNTLVEGKISKDYLVKRCDQLIDFEKQIGPDGKIMGRRPTKYEINIGIKILHDRILTCLSS